MQYHLNDREGLMNVYILRHAEAVEGKIKIPDEWRYLTEKGRKQTNTVAKRLGKGGLKSCLIVSSPLVRAVQTAQIVGEKIGKKCQVEINGLLMPGSDITELADSLFARKGVENIMLVGHEPQLGGLIAALLKLEDTIQLKKLGCVELEITPNKPEKAAKFNACIVPGKKTVTSLKKAFNTEIK